MHNYVVNEQLVLLLFVWLIPCI